MNEVRALELIAKKLTGEITPEEDGQLMVWAEASDENQAFFRDTAQLWERSGDLAEEAFAVDTGQAWQQLESRLEEPPSATVVSMRPRFPWWRAAAAAALLLVGALIWQLLAPSFSPDRIEVVTAAGERKEWTLPDASTVVLNESSRLEYVAGFEQRQVVLQGEAFFSVVRDPERPFSVQAGEVVTNVLGTKFTVRAYAQEAVVDVQVQEGLVAVAPSSDVVAQPVQVAAGQGITYQRESRTLQPLATADPNADAFADQELVFTDAPLQAVIEDMSDYYGTPLRLANAGLGNCRVSITFQGVELDEALERLSFILNLTVTREEDHLLLDGTPCDN